MSLPQSVTFSDKEVPIFTFKQLEQKPRLTLKNIAMNLRDMIGAERLPPLRAAGSLEEVTSWIIDVQCMLAKAVGMDISPEALGQPSDFGMAEAGLMGGPQAQAQGGGRRDNRPEFDAMPTHDTMAAAAATKAKNQRGSNIFGSDDEAPKAYQQQRQPMQPLGQGGPNDVSAMAAYTTAMDQAAATRARNQRGSNIFG